MQRTIPLLALAIFVTVVGGAGQRAMAEPVDQPAAADIGGQAAGVPEDPAEPVYRVVSPLGDPTVKTITMAPRLDSLARKTVCMIWNQSFAADITLPAIGESLKEKYPDIKIIPYMEIDAAIRDADRDDPSAVAAALQTVLKEKGCDAVISGNGG